MLLKNSKALEKIATENANLFVRIGKAIKEFIAKLRKAQKDMYEDVGELHDAAVRLRETLKSFEELQSIFDEALTNSIRNMRNALAEAENAKAKANLDVLEKAAEEDSINVSEDSLQLSEEYDRFGNKYWHIETSKDIFAGLKSNKQIEKAAYDYLLENRDYNVVLDTVDGKKVKFIRLSADEFTKSKNSQNLKGNNPVVFKQKMRLIPSLQDLLLNANVNWHADDMKNHNLFKKRGFENYRGRLRIDDTIFNYVVRVGEASFGNIFYDINLEVDSYLPHAESASDIKGNESTSVPNISDSEQNVNSKLQNSEEISERDDEYLKLAKDPKKNAAQLRKLVAEAAKAAGFNSPMLYHGTKNAGFSGFDLSKMDDGSSIFLTSSPAIASTYSGVAGARSIADMRTARSIDTMSAEELTKALNAHSKQNAETDEGIYNYEIYDLKKKEHLTKDVEKDAERLSKTVERLTGEYADRLAEDFDDKTAAVHRQLAELSEKLADGKYSELSTPIYMLLHHTDAFKGEAGIAELEKNIRLMNKLNGAKMTSEGVIVKEGLDGYDLRVLSTEQARNELRAAEGAGNYAVFARLGNSLSVDAHGDNWNALDFRIPDSKYEISEDEGQYRIIDKSTRTAVWSDGKMRWDSREEAQKIIDSFSDKDGWTKRLNTTRQIAEYAKANGYDSVVFKNLRDNGGMNSNVSLDTASDVYVLFNPNDVKSADLITYDDNGNIIPLSERFNTGNDDLRYSEETSEEFAENEKSAIEKALANMSVKDYNRRGWARTLLTREDASKLYSAIAELFTNKKRKEFRLKDGSYAIEVNNKIIFVSGTYENPRYESVLVFNTDNATDMEFLKDQFFGSAATTGLSQKDIERFIKQRRGNGQVYGFYAEDYKASGRRDFGRAMLRSNAKGFGDTARLKVRDGIHTKDEGDVSLRVQGLKFSEETETSRDTLVSDMEAVAETAKNEGKNSGMLLKDGALAIEMNNKIVFADENFEDPSYYAVLVFDAENATDMELSKYIYLRGRNYNELTKFDINRKILTEGNKFGTYGYNARDYKTSRKEFAGRAMLKSYTKGFGDVSQLIVRGGVYTENKRSLSRSVSEIKFTEETSEESLTVNKVYDIIKSIKEDEDDNTFNQRFRDIQKACREMSEGELQAFRSDRTKLDERVRAGLRDVFQRRIRTGSVGNRNGNALRLISKSGEQFNIVKGRTLNRYLSTGRFLSPELVAEYGDRPTQNFESIINTEELIDGYSRYSNDVARGEKPILKGESPHLHSGRTGRYGLSDNGKSIKESGSRETSEYEKLKFSEETDECTKAVLYCLKMKGRMLLPFLFLCKKEGKIVKKPFTKLKIYVIVKQLNF